MSKEKKKTIIFTVVLAVIAVALLTVFIVDALKQSGTIANSETNEIMKDFNKYFKSKERTVIYYASAGCSYCTLQSPILETIAEDYDMDYLYIDSSKLGLKQRTQVLEKLGIEHATPTTIIVENGKVIDKAVGYTEGKKYVEFFKENEILPEDAVYSAEQYLTFIDYKEYEELVSHNGTNIIVLGQTTCGHCIAIKPALNSVAGNYDLTINYLNISDITKDEYKSLIQNLKDIEYDDPDFVNKESFGTPLTLIVKNGKVIDYISGQRTISQLVREFKKSGLITE